MKEESLWSDRRLARPPPLEMVDLPVCVVGRNVDPLCFLYVRKVLLCDCLHHCSSDTEMGGYLWQDSSVGDDRHV